MAPPIDAAVAANAGRRPPDWKRWIATAAMDEAAQVGEPFGREFRPSGRYFTERNSASAKALSSLTRGRV
jgi:hypothetical protein